MVRVVDSHIHRHNSGQIGPAMYPYHSKHWRDLRGDFNQPKEEMMPTDQRSTSNGNLTNMPNLDILGRMVIDADTAHRAVGALRCCVSTNESDTNCVKEDDTDSDYGRVMRGSLSYTDDDRVCDDNDHEIPSFSLLDHPRDRHNSADTESDYNDSIAQLSGIDPKERRRQRNKLSARAYRDRKRTLTQEQGQIVATLEAEQIYLREKVRKLQVEKREFLRYLKSEMNIDMPNEDTGEFLSTPANDS